MMNLSEISLINIRLLPVLHGDAIHLTFSGTDRLKHHIFIDGGFESTYRLTLKKRLRELEIPTNK